MSEPIRYALSESANGPEFDSLVIISGTVIKQMFPSAYGFADVKAYLIEEQGQDMAVIQALTNPYYKANNIICTLDNNVSLSTDPEAPLNILVDGKVQDSLQIFANTLLDIALTNDTSFILKALSILRTENLSINSDVFSHLVHSPITINDEGGLILYANLPNSAPCEIGKPYYSERPVTLTYLPLIKPAHHSTYMVEVRLSHDAGSQYSMDQSFDRFNVSVNTHTLTPLQEVEGYSRMRLIDYLNKSAND